MKKILFALLLGLTVVSSVIQLSAPVSYAEDGPEEPKPEKPSD